MRLDSRIELFLFGCVIGFIVGYIVRSLRDIRKKVNEVDEIVKKKQDRGAVSIEALKNLALFVVVILTVWAAWTSQKSSDKTQDTQIKQKVTQNQLVKITSCNQDFLAKTIAALNARTVYSQDQAKANVDLQSAQLKLLTLAFKKPPLSDSEGAAAVKTYFDALTTFVSFSSKQTNAIAENPYPTSTAFSDCLKNGK